MGTAYFFTYSLDNIVRINNENNNTKFHFISCYFVKLDSFSGKVDENGERKIEITHCCIVALCQKCSVFFCVVVWSVKRDGRISKSHTRQNHCNEKNKKHATNTNSQKLPLSPGAILSNMSNLLTFIGGETTLMTLKQEKNRIIMKMKREEKKNTQKNGLGQKLQVSILWTELRFKWNNTVYKQAENESQN